MKIPGNVVESLLLSSFISLHRGVTSLQRNVVEYREILFPKPECIVTGHRSGKRSRIILDSLGQRLAAVLDRRQVRHYHRYKEVGQGRPDEVSAGKWHRLASAKLLSPARKAIHYGEMPRLAAPPVSHALIRRKISCVTR